MECTFHVKTLWITRLTWQSTHSLLPSLNFLVFLLPSLHFLLSTLPWQVRLKRPQTLIACPAQSADNWANQTSCKLPQLSLTHKPRNLHYLSLSLSFPLFLLFMYSSLCRVLQKLRFVCDSMRCQNWHLLPTRVANLRHLFGHTPRRLLLSLPPPFCVDFAKNSYDSLSLSLSLLMCVFVSGNLFLIVYDFVCFFSHEINFISLLNFKFGPSKKFWPRATHALWPLSVNLYSPWTHQLSGWAHSCIILSVSIRLLNNPRDRER